MGDFEDVEEIAANLVMNEREKARYELHKERIHKFAIRAKFWRFWNIVWQIIFFWGLVVIAIDAGKHYASLYAPSLNSFFDIISYATSPMSLVVGILGPFSFFLMIYTGIVRSKWEGKLTRATAYALSFLSNIEHREYVVLEKEMPKSLKPKPKPKVGPVQGKDVKRVIEAQRKTTDQKAEVLKSFKEGKLTRAQFEARMMEINRQGAKK